MFVQEQYKVKLQELAKLKEQVKLEIDPVSSGLPSFNLLIANLQSVRERIAAMALEGLWNKEENQQALNTAKALYEGEKDKLLSANDEIKALRSNELRMAKVNTILETQLKAVQDSEQLADYADAYHKSVQIVDKLYDNKNNNLLQQILVVRMMTNIDPALRDELRIQNKETNK